MSASPPANDSQLRWAWPAVYKPAWKIISISVAVGVVAFWTGGLAHYIPLLVAVLLWPWVVVAIALEKRASWSAALLAGATCLAAILGLWIVWGLILLVATQGS